MDPPDQGAVDALLTRALRENSEAVTSMVARLSRERDINDIVVFIYDVYDERWRDWTERTADTPFADYQAQVVAEAASRGVRPVFVVGLNRSAGQRIAGEFDNSVASRLAAPPDDPRGFWCVVNLDGMIVCAARSFYRVTGKPGLA